MQKSITLCSGVFRTQFFTGLFFLFCTMSAFAQNAQLSGTITEAGTGEALVGCALKTVGGNLRSGVTTNLDGRYSLSLPPGSYTFECYMTGFDKAAFSVELIAGETKVMDVRLNGTINLLQQTTVTAGKYEKALGEVTVSLDILKPRLIESVNSTSVDEVLAKVPGVTILDGQASIRGGAGYSYGAGTRVLLLVDDIPALQADAGYPNWDDFPVENINQVEVLKGAASALYGSSAMNGIINFRTGFAKDKPETDFATFGKLWNDPRDPAKKWWGNDTSSLQTPFESGMSIAHRRKIGKLDVVVGAYALYRDSYNKDTYSRYTRITPNFRYAVNDRLTIGLNSNFNFGRSSSFFIWGGDDERAYQPGLGSINRSLGRTRFTIDPSLQYFDRAGNRHKILSRFYSINNRNDMSQGNTSKTYYGEYQFQRASKKIGLVTTAGIVGTYATVSAPLYNNSNYSIQNGAAYLQLDYKPTFLPRLNLSTGARYERNKLVSPELIRLPDNTFDTIPGGQTTEGKPVFRFGANYQVGKATFFRASWGQGYRYPTIAEKFINTNFSSVNTVSPNVNLVSETGWSAEFALKQGFPIGAWQGYMDAAIFTQRYQNMMEFVFTKVQFVPGSGIGAVFQSRNQGNTRINGAEISFAGQGQLGPGQLFLLAGYTRVNPKYETFDRNSGYDPTLGEVSRFWGSSDTVNNVLKYRFRDVVKWDAEYLWRGFSTGLSVQYNSNMQSIDRVFEVFLPGVESFRKSHTKGFTLIDLRMSYQISKALKVTAIAANLANVEYTVRPAQLEAPRSYTLRLDYKIR